ncbi:MAG: RdgB/HAM1 family non-canonical purine NTP pyrophosphatase [Peptostreptococcaceae bacterium]|nr:RdgB/HAM1 family non-canonical purine NTP pyrophosphatase [Peptostreptococcaceae bacterium]
MKMILASQNKHKLKEIEKITKNFGIELVTMEEAGLGDFDVVEDKDTFEGNSEKKAMEVMEASGFSSVADDSGLVVDALGGEPGVYSARFSGPEATYESNNKKLLEMMKDVPWEKRTARFVSVITAVFTDGRTLVARGEIEGHIAFREKGDGGFGYDPLFYVAEKEKTFAELSGSEKNSISHRANALEGFKKLLMAEGDLPK